MKTNENIRGKWRSLTLFSYSSKIGFSIGIGIALILFSSFSQVSAQLLRRPSPSLTLNNRRTYTNPLLPSLYARSLDSGNSDAVNAKDYVPNVKLISEDPKLIRFLLYSNSRNKDEFEVLELGKVESILSSKYDQEKPVKFLVHGFQNSFRSQFPQNVKDAYLTKNQDNNVIVVDWSPLAIPNAPYVAPAFYPFAVKNVLRTGERLGEFITWLIDQHLTQLDLIHIIGFSLGSHVAGKAASDVQDDFEEPIARVTALDPAGPEFYTGILARTLRPSDARYVDVSHTNAGQLGIWANIGKVDYYINGGSGPQPGCIGLDSVNSVLRSITGTVLGSCSHAMAPKFFAKTILAENLKSEDSEVCSCGTLTRYTLKSCKCETTVGFGEYSSPLTRGKHYISLTL